MAANSAGNPVFNAQNLSNSYTNINGALVTPYSTGRIPSSCPRVWSPCHTAPPIALAQIQQQLGNILQQLQQFGPMNANIVGLRADIVGLQAESYNNNARIQNTRVWKVADPLAPLRNVITNDPIPNFPATPQLFNNFLTFPPPRSLPSWVNLESPSPLQPTALL